MQVNFASGEVQKGGRSFAPSEPGVLVTMVGVIGRRSGRPSLKAEQLMHAGKPETYLPHTHSTHPGW